MNDFTHYRYLIENTKTGERRTELSEKAKLPPLSPGERIKSIIGGTKLMERKGRSESQCKN